MLKDKFKLLSILLAFVFVVSCSDDDDSNNPSKQSESQILAEYIESTSNYANTNAPAMILASEVKQLIATNDVYVIDVRAASDYANGHIEGAVNVTIPGILDHLESINVADYQKIAVVCYSGQSASFATSLMRLMGYDNIYTLKFGMCSWAEETMGSWPANIGSSRSSQFTSDVTAMPEKGDLPEINTGESTGDAILRARVEAVLNQWGDSKITHDQVFGALDNYYIANYWKEAHYLDPGHIPGAVQYTPKSSLALDTYLTTLSTEKPNVIYCYTGQTSAHITAFLRVLGYDAKSLLFGCNGMIYNDMDGREGFPVWHDTYNMGYDLVK